MAEVSINLNGKPYVVGCEDGQERHLAELARRFDVQVQQIAGAVGQLSDTRLFMMAGLMMADELAEAGIQLERARADLAQATSTRGGAEDKAIAALAVAARRIEALAGKVGQNAV